MNREIKFRTWDRELKEMFYDFHINSLGKFQEWGDRGGKYSNENEPIIMQLTGLTDKLEKEIYEGDILEVENQQSEVEWGKHSASWILPDADGMYLLGDIPKGDREIIGNIYENPELLNK